MKQVLGTLRRHKTGVGCTPSQKIHHNTLSSSSSSEGRLACVDSHVVEYLRRSYEQNLQMYENHQIMQELVAQLQPNIKFPTITHPEPDVRPGPPPSPDVGYDDANDAANLRDS